MRNTSRRVMPPVVARSVMSSLPGVRSWILTFFTIPDLTPEHLTFFTIPDLTPVGVPPMGGLAA